MLQPVLRPLLRSPLRQATAPAPGNAGGSPPAETFYLLDEAGNILTDEASNRLTGT